MLHALLRGKLDERVPEPQRIEDALTSTVFGTLLLAGSADMLASWLCESRTLTAVASRSGPPHRRRPRIAPEVADADP